MPSGERPHRQMCVASNTNVLQRLSSTSLDMCRDDVRDNRSKFTQKCKADGVFENLNFKKYKIFYTKV